jgi:acyl carrier protein
VAEPGTATDDAVLSEVRRRVGARLGGIDCGDDDVLDDLGFGSIDLIVVLSSFEQRFHFSIDEQDLTTNDLSTLLAIARFVEAKVRAIRSTNVDR